jgi:hypothetical protein
LLQLLLVWAVYSSMHVACGAVGCRLCGANNGQGDVTAVDAAGCLCCWLCGNPAVAAAAAVVSRPPLVIGACLTRD